MLSAFTNSLKIPELRQRIFFTLALLFIARVGANIPLPGMNTAPIQEFFSQQAGGAGGLIGFYNMFTGGALLNGALFALGIMPYISASIIMQLMGAVFPSIARLQQEGDVGRQKLNDYTRYLTIIICAIQGFLLLFALSTNPGTLIGYGFNPLESGQIVIASKVQFLLTGTIFLTAGSMILVWLGEQITEKGIGNGISLLITVSIISALPGAVVSTYQMFVAPVGSETQSLGMVQGVLMLALLFSSDCWIGCYYSRATKDTRSIRQACRWSQGLRRTNLLLAPQSELCWVMPVIFASAILMFPAQLLNILVRQQGCVSSAILRKHWGAVSSLIILFLDY